MASCINAIRVLANPAEKNKAHITVRGPYPRRDRRSGRFSRFVEGSEINIVGPGHFFDFEQNTVYLRCVSPELKIVWDKPDYGFNPHITLYDGASSEFARKLWDIVSQHPLKFSFVAGPLAPLVSSRRHQGGMALKTDLDSRFLCEVTGVDFSKTPVESLESDARLKAIDRLCGYLSTYQSKSGLRRLPGVTDEATAFQVTEVDVSSRFLTGIKALARKNSTTLGFLPEGAFDAYAQRGWVLAAIADGDVAGYVIYRISRMRASLVHLCTNERYRGQGIARQLFLTVVDRTSDLRGILANTRRDFPAHTLWPRLGFAAIGEKPGRGKHRSVLTRWWYEHPHPTLFSNQGSSVSAQSPIDVAIDLDIFYDVVMPWSRKGADDSRSLLSDWLGDEIQICVTSELFNEINGLENTQSKQEQWTLAHEFKRISGEAKEFHNKYSLLSSIIEDAKNDHQASHLRHLAHAAAANVEFFATRDDRMLSFRKEIERQVGVTPIQPADLVIEIDQVRSVASYQPVRLRGSTLHIAKFQRTLRERLENVFSNKGLGETKGEFRKRLSDILPTLPSVDSRVVLDDGEPVALFGLEGSDSNILKVPCLRFSHGPLARTLARQIVTMAVDSSIENGYSITTVTDDWLEPHVEEVLSDAGFAKAGAHWVKLNYSAIGTEDDVASGLGHLLEQLRDSEVHLPGTLRFPLQAECRLTATETVLMERTLRPLKLTNDALDTMVIPVMPRWAQHLFDSGLAEQTLFGVQPDLLLRWENAYYRSPRSLGDILAPFRILWYVSQDGRYTGTGQIRAYSVGSSVEVLPAYLAYERYKRLGVYELGQVLDISDGDPDGPVMVIRFCDIEVFKRPVDRTKFCEILELSDNKRPSLRGPQRISQEAFASIYSEGQS